ncbi:helix-turn-helix transcriptional regulator [Rathayibacter sp. ZW T2_19]|uniref:Helix-turn-helix transcriptional regulator n=1 Tax=Rathayibacter rubneri TaxID=2950106 RepID=A0A9X2DW00_9MICO|nr:helix-turn-helix domain-containing protein [Rathayibacter rubneri]MCM6761543.1 helix-turn-helix transcriptional regulator [Rathayibacter rubneri]
MSHGDRGRALQERLSESMPSMHQLCSGESPELFRSLMSRIGDKWTLLVIGVLGSDRLRFTEIADTIPGISRRMLTVTLRALERDGLVSRTVYAQVPPRVEYEVTDLGRSLQTVAFAVGDWVGEHQQTIVENRRGFDAAADSAQRGRQADEPIPAAQGH